MHCSLPDSVEFSGKHTGVGCYSLLQGIFLTQGLNLGLPHHRQILYHLNYQEVVRVRVRVRVRVSSSDEEGDAS